MIPATFEIPTTEDPTDIVTFTKDTITESQDVQVQTSFSQIPVSYPTIQIQYATADTRINFMNFYLGITRDPTIYLDKDPDTDSWINVKNNEQIFPITMDDLDHTMQISIKCRYIADSTSRLQFDLFKLVGASYLKIDSNIIYGWDFSSIGSIRVIFENMRLLATDLYKIRITSLGDGGVDDTGVEVAVDVSSNIIYQAFEAIVFEDHGNVENLFVSIRVISDNKPTSRSPGLTKFIESEDVCDTIVRQIETRFFKEFDDTIDEAQLIKASNIYDVTGAVASGSQENVTARQIDFMIANLNRLREQINPVGELVINVTQDDSSNTIS